MKNFTMKSSLSAFLILLMLASSLTSFAGIRELVQTEKVTLDVKNSTISNALDAISKESGVRIFYKSGLADLQKNISVEIKAKTVSEAVKYLLAETNLDFEVSDKGIVILTKEVITSKATQQQKKISVKGKVIGEDKQPITGATILVIGTTQGAITDDKGAFALNIIEGSEVEISCVGLTSVTRKITAADSGKGITITMKSKAMNVDNVIVTGYFERDKNSFTGAAKTVSGDQIRNISSTNIMNALSILDPSIQIVQNNDQGSNPNAIPELIIRGTSSLNAYNEFGVNSPLIVIDGVETNLRALYDIDISDIESVAILKDASATALYGEQAANGVILITRIRVSNKALRVSYNFIGKVEFPDLTAYNLMNAKEKLDYELYAGIYDDNTGNKYMEYVAKQAIVNAGMNTDWIAKPLRNAFSHTHNASISGEGSGVFYQLTARYSSINGVMKADNRSNTGVGVYLQHNLNQKLITTIRSDFAQNKSKRSNYGIFQDYVNANPYDAPYDKDGKINNILSYDLANPLYEAGLSSFSKSKEKEFNASLNVRWNILKGFYVVGFGSISTVDGRDDSYVSPLSSMFKNEIDSSQKGFYGVDASTGNSYYGKISANFNRNLDQKGSMISFNAGGEIRKSNMNPYGFETVGFFNDRLTDPTFGAGFAQGTKPTGQSSESATVALVAAANIVFRNRYFADASYRVSGSSKFGKENRYAPFWSAGLGWNIHKESFAKNAKWIDVMRVRGSYGSTGSVNFSSYQAITTYLYHPNFINKYGIGASPITMGNEKLKWQTTNKFNVGLTSTLFNERLDINFDYYNELTYDMIMPISMPPSTGVTTTYNNLGEQENKGFELTLSGILIKNRDWMWRVTMNGASNKNTLLKIGEALKLQNDIDATVATMSPLSLYIEGKSTSQLYTVRSAGIDPANGREIYIDKNGKYTYVYNPLDKVAVGDTNPSIRGAMSSFLTYKGFSLNISLQYSYGAYIYNATRAMRVEQVNPRYNADHRAYSQRWKNPGDIVNYLTMRPDRKGNITNIHTQRFVEKENYLSISYVSLGYEFTAKSLQKIGFKRLNLSASMNDVTRFSTVKQERGTSYPFARGFSFTISPTF